MNGVESMDFMDRTCNCNAISKVNFKCIFDSDCRKCCVIYKATRKCCDMHYIGCTQNAVKNRVRQIARMREN